MKFDKFYHEAWGILLTGFLTLAAACLCTYFLLPKALGTPDNPTFAIFCIALLVVGFFSYLIYTIGETDNGFVCFLTVLFTVVIDLGAAIASFFYGGELNSIVSSNVSPWIWVIPLAIAVGSAATPLLANLEGDGEIYNFFAGIMFRYNPIICFLVFYFGIYGLSYVYSSVPWVFQYILPLLPIVFLVLNIVSWAKQGINIDNDLQMCPTIASTVSKHNENSAYRKEANAKWDSIPEPECFKGLSEDEKLKMFEQLKDNHLNYCLRVPQGGLKAEEFMVSFCNLLMKEYGFESATHEHIEYRYDDENVWCKAKVHLKVKGAFPVTFSGVDTGDDILQVDRQARRQWEAMRPEERSAQWGNDFHSYLYYGSGLWDRAAAKYRNGYRKAMKATMRKASDIFHKYFDWVNGDYGVYGMKDHMIGTYKPPHKKRVGVWQWTTEKLDSFQIEYDIEEVH